MARGRDPPAVTAKRRLPARLLARDRAGLASGDLVDRVKSGGMRVVTVTWNSRAELDGFVGALRSAGIRDDQLIVVDNSSTDGTVDHMTAIAPRATVLSTGRNAGYGAAINRALRTVPAEHAVLVLNPDTRVRPGAIEQLLRSAATPGTGVVAPALLDPTGRLAPSARRDPTWWRTLADAVLGGKHAGRIGLGELVLPPPAAARAVAWTTGAALLVTPEARRAVGAWEESFFLYSEEVDFCQRVRDRGLGVVIDPRAEVVHVGGRIEVDERLWSLRAINGVLHARRRQRPLAARLFHLSSLLFELRRAAGGQRTSRAALTALCSNDLLRARDDLLPADVDAPLRSTVPVVVSTRPGGVPAEPALDLLLGSAEPEEFEVVVVVQGDGSGAVTSPVSGATHGDAGASTAAAIRHALQQLDDADGGPVLHIDVDVRLSTLGARRLVRLVQRGDVDMAVPSMHHDTTGTSPGVRSYLRLWRALDRPEGALSATGAVALAASVVQELARRPDRDDLVVPRDRRRRAPDVVATVPAPRDVTTLVRLMTARDDDLRAPPPPPGGRATMAAVLRAIRRSPWHAIDLPGFLWVRAQYRRAQRHARDHQ